MGQFLHSLKSTKFRKTIKMFSIEKSKGKNDRAWNDGFTEKSLCTRIVEIDNYKLKLWLGYPH